MFGFGSGPKGTGSGYQEDSNVHMYSVYILSTVKTEVDIMILGE
jgi:hypothetical protein